MAKRQSKGGYSAAELSRIIGIAPKNIRAGLKKHGSIPHFGIVAGNKTKLYSRDQLPPVWQTKVDRHEAEQLMRENGLEPAVQVDPATVEETAIAYSEAPKYNRRKFDKYAVLLHELEIFDGQELRDKIAEWNQKHPGNKTSYPSVMRARKAVKEQGHAVLIGKHGKRRGTSKIPDDVFYYWWSLYATEGSPSNSCCWRITVGQFCKGGSLEGFPSEDSFLYRARHEFKESVIFYARNGFKKWNRKYGSYIERDYSDLRAGQCWVSDHAQIDVAVKGPDGKPGYGWLTSFMDMKTSKVLSRFFHMEAPNSDHIFQAFYMAAERFGLPDYCYIDNGRDYKCRDFALGRKDHKVSVDESKARTMLLALNITPIFAQPYNAQAKTIEPMHLRIKKGLSMIVPGYRGGNVVERPEKLAGEIAAGAIMNFAEFRGHLYTWLDDVLNATPSKGKALQGMSPNDLWNLENPVKRMVSKDALQLFCMRTSRTLTIGRNGITDSALGVTYFAEWMTAAKGAKVYLRRAVENFGDAWVFSAETDEFLGSAAIPGTVPALAHDEISKQQLNDALARQRRERKAIKVAGVVKTVPSVTEIIENQKAAAALLNPSPVPESKRTVAKIGRTKMDDAVNQRRKSEQPADTRKPRIAAELEHARKQLDYHKNRLIAYPSEKAEKQQAIEHWTGELVRIEAEWRAVG